MKLFDYFENKLSLGELAKRNDLKDWTFVFFDLETNGLIANQGLRLITGEKKYDPETKRMRNVYKDSDLHIAEIGAKSFNPKSTFHEFIKANLDHSAGDGKTIKELISWSDFKEENAKNIHEVMKSFESYLKRFPKRVIFAHNGFEYDFKIMNLLGKKLGYKYIEDVFSDNDSDSTILVDTKKTSDLREKLSHLGWPTKTDKKGKEIEANRQDDLLKIFGIQNKGAHTAIEDVTALSKLIIKLSKELKASEIS